MNMKSTPINELKPYKKNARKNKAAVAIVKQSIENFGFRNPILVDQDMIIIAGHTRLEAAIELGLKRVPTIQINDLTEDQIKAFRIMDNKSSEFAEWDYDLLKGEFNALKDTDSFNFTGFSNKEITSIWEKSEAKLLDPEEDDVNEVDQLGHLIIECPKCKFKIKRKK